MVAHISHTEAGGPVSPDDSQALSQKQLCKPSAAHAYHPRSLGSKQEDEDGPGSLFYTLSMSIAPWDPVLIFKFIPYYRYFASMCTTWEPSSQRGGWISRNWRRNHILLFLEVPYFTSWLILMHTKVVYELLLSRKYPTLVLGIFVLVFFCLLCWKVSGLRFPL